MSSQRSQKVWTIVVAGGSGTRFGGPKQYEMLGSQRVLDWSVAAARDASDGVVLVVPAADATREGGIAGGASRSGSVRAGLAHVPDDATIVLVHDAARPFADADLFQRVGDAVADGADAALPGVAVADTIKQIDGDGTVVHTPPRAELTAVQTPQGFRFDAILAAHRAHPGDAADDVEVARAAGLDVTIVEGDEDNIKLTFPGDFARAERIIAARLAR
ncbi:MAG: 2-C-methyl-D-erythritol 4-phosphate cytidylyltransferase [Actinomycetota bacterium]